MVEQRDVERPSGWPALSGAVVLDPMVVRTAHLFVRGAADLDDGIAAEASRALRENTSALRDFIDLLVLHDHLHVFDYAATWPEGLLGDPAELWGLSDALGLGLVSVRVHPDAYGPAKAEAIAELQRVLDMRASSAWPEESLSDLIASISDELQSFEYQWHPDLSALTVPAGVPLDATALRFAFGERLFNTYAQYVGGVHVLQSKRLALAEHLYLGAAGRDVLANPDVLARLAADVNERRPAGEPLAVTDVLPSFAGYLLEQKPASPRELFDQAVQLRAEKAVARHRTNLFTLRASVGTGSFSAEAVSDLAASAAGVTDWLREQWAGVTPVQRTNFLAIHGPTVAADLATTGGVVTSVMAAAGVAALSAKFFLGDAREQRSYAKLLGDARREQQRWDEENKLLALWGVGVRDGSSLSRHAPTVEVRWRGCRFSRAGLG